MPAFLLAEDKSWASTHTLTDLEGHAMFKTLTDLTENGTTNLKEITGKLTEIRITWV